MTIRFLGALFLVAVALTAPAVQDPVVTVPADAPAAVRIAAEEFQKYWGEITGRRIDVTVQKTDRVTEASGVSRVRIGFPSQDPLFAGETDAYVVTSTADGLEISGKNPRSVLYGVYEFFRQRCGCRWFWDGDVVPKAERIALTGVDIREKAQFLYRGCQYFSHRGLARFHAEMWGWQAWRRELDWCVKNRLNLFMLHFGKEDLFQLAYPDIVPYPDPAVTEPCDAMGEFLQEGYNQRTSLWSMKYRNLLRHCILAYARDRGMIHPEKIGPMTHWFARTPPEFLKAKKPAFTPQVYKTYGEPSGLVWDVRQKKWFDEYWNLTEAAVREYGEPGMFFNMGFDERTVYTNRADNVALKIDIMKRYNDESHRRRPDAPVIMEGWDFFLTWHPDEVKQLLKALDPGFAIVWDFTADDAVGFVRRPGVPKHNVFTGWGVTNAFPYSFGVTLAHNRGMDIRGQYGAIREREKAIVGDPMCKAYIIWPETSHSDIFAWRYFTENCWSLSPKETDALLADFCRDRYGSQAGAFKEAWNRIIPLSQLWDWARSCSDIIGWYMPRRLNESARWLATGTPAVVAEAPAVFAALAEIDWNGDFVRRDALDIARTAFDRSIWFAYEELLRSYHLAAQGQATPTEVKKKAKRCTALVRTFADVLTLHPDFSLTETMDRVNEEERVRNPRFEHVLFENSACRYCLSHQAEYAKGWYVPATEELAALLVSRVEAKDFSPLPAPTDFRAKLRALAHPIRSFAPGTAQRTPENFRRLMRKAALL